MLERGILICWICWGGYMSKSFTL